MILHELYPYLRVHDGAAAIDYYLRVFGGELTLQVVDPTDGRVGHAELTLAPGRVLMVSDEYPEMGILGPREGGGGLALHLHVDDADALIARMVEAGGTLKRPAADQFYGERTGTVVDPFGHEWMVGHSIEVVDGAEMQRRWDAMVGGAG